MLTMKDKWVMLGCLIYAFILGFNLVLPIFTGKSGLQYLTALADDVFPLGGKGNTTNSSYGHIENSEYSPDLFYYRNGTFHLINTTVVPKSLQISGRDYSFGVTEGWFSAFFRSQSSDTRDRPVAMVQDNYTLTFSPEDFVILQPHKGTTEGKVGILPASSKHTKRDFIYALQHYCSRCFYSAVRIFVRKFVEVA